VHVTHSIVEARTLGTRLGVIVAGKLEQVGPVAEVFDRPENRLVARALAVSNFVDGIPSAEGSLLDVGPGLPVAIVSGLGQRARLFDLALADAPGNRTRPGEVVARQVDKSGDESLWVRLDGTDIEIEVHSVSNRNAREGSRVHVDFSHARAERY
jgi:ABC-type Fe3+/spermidine/putrescine transport system ATPase subunit